MVDLPTQSKCLLYDISRVPELVVIVYLDGTVLLMFAPDRQLYLL